MILKSLRVDFNQVCWVVSSTIEFFLSKSRDIHVDKRYMYQIHLDLS